MQKTLLEFFEIIERADWQQTLRDIVNKRNMNIWDINVSELAKGYLEILKKEQDFAKTMKGFLICSILLKYKSNRLHLRDLEKIIEEEVEEIVEENEIPETLPEQLSQALENDDRQVGLDKLQKAIDILTQPNKTKRKKYKQKTFYFKVSKKVYEETTLKIYNYLQQNKSMEYKELLNEIKKPIFQNLLNLNHEEKISLRQKQFYDKLFIKLKNWNEVS